MKYRIHFVVPPFGAEFASTDSLVENWRRAGMQVVAGDEDQLKDDTLVFHRAAKGGGIATVPADPGVERRLLTINDRLMARAAPYGTEIGNSDAMSLRDRVQMILPERSPAWVVEPGVKPFRLPTVCATFEHSALAGRDVFLLLVPKTRGFSLDGFLNCCREINMVAAPVALDVADVIPDLQAWFADPKRKLVLLKVSNAAKESTFLHFARLYYACLQYEGDFRGLDSAHLVADFGSQQPNFRRHWTSNK